MQEEVKRTVTIEITPEIQQEAVDFLNQIGNLARGVNPAAVHIAVVELYRQAVAQGFQLKRV